MTSNRSCGRISITTVIMQSQKFFGTRSVQELTGSFCSSQQNSWCGESGPTSWCGESGPTSWCGESDHTSWCGESGPTSWCGESGPTSWFGESLRKREIRGRTTYNLIQTTFRSLLFFSARKKHSTCRNICCRTGLTDIATCGGNDKSCEGYDCLGHSFIYSPVCLFIHKSIHS